MPDKIVWRALGVIALAALAGCSENQTALRNSVFAPMDTLTLQGKVSTDFRRHVLTVIHFDFDSDQLDGEASGVVASQASWILQNPNVKFAVTGHTDRMGNAAYNLDLGLRRANRVVARLIELGVSEKQLIAMVTQGEEQPLIKTEDRERANRRTVTEVIGFLEPPIFAKSRETQHGRDSTRDTPQILIAQFDLPDDPLEEGPDGDNTPPTDDPDPQDEGQDGDDPEGNGPQDDGSDHEGPNEDGDDDEGTDDEGGDRSSDDQGSGGEDDEGSNDEDDNHGASNGKGGNHPNNGHGNDEDGDDDSNPGKKNSGEDTTDDDGVPGNGGGAKKGQS